MLKMKAREVFACFLSCEKLGSGRKNPFPLLLFYSGKFVSSMFLTRCVGSVVAPLKLCQVKSSTSATQMSSF